MCHSWCRRFCSCKWRATALLHNNKTFTLHLLLRNGRHVRASFNYQDKTSERDLQNLYTFAALQYEIYKVCNTFAKCTFTLTSKYAYLRVNFIYAYLRVKMTQDTPMRDPPSHHGPKRRGGTPPSPFQHGQFPKRANTR